MQWRPVKGFEDKYLVSDTGLVYGIKRKHNLAIQTDSRGYKRVMLSIAANTMKYVWVHRLVAEAFCEGYQKGYEVNHKDFDRGNNKASNLEWVSHLDNTRYTISAGRFKYPPRNYGNFFRNSYLQNLRNCGIIINANWEMDSEQGN